MLTVGVPTFNRGNSVARLACHMSGATSQGNFEVVVIDDGSQDATLDLLSQAAATDGMRVESNPRNLGYSRTFLRLFEECQTEYLLVAADDDCVDIDVVVELREWLPSARPDLVSTQWHSRTGDIRRGRSKTGPIDPADFWACAAHAPGLVYRVGACRSALAILRELLDEGSEIAVTYPQVVVTAVLLASGGQCMWWAGAPVNEGDGFETGLIDAAGEPYWALSPRLRQHVSLAALLVDLDAPASMQAAHDKLLYPMVRKSLGTLQPGLEDTLDAGARRHLRRSLAIRLLRPLMQHVLRR